MKSHAGRVHRTGTERRRRRLASVAAAIAALIAIQFVVNEASAVTPDPAAQDLQDVLSTLGGLDTLGPLAQPIPLSDQTPAELLGIGDLLDSLAAALADGELTPATLEALEGAHGPFTVVVNGPDGASEAVVAPSPGDPDVRDIIFQIEATAAGVELPVSVADDLVELDGAAGPGGTVTVEAVVSTTMLHFQYDDAETDPALLDQALWLRTLPADPVPVAERVAPSIDLALTASDSDIDAFNARVGLGDVSVSGTLDLDANVDIALLDPDGSATDDRISFDEFTSTSVLDLATAQFVDGASPQDIDAQLTLAVTSATGFPTASVSLVDDDLSADPPPTPMFELGEQSALLNMSATDVIGSVERLANYLSSLSTGGRLDPQIPFIGDSFSDVLDPGAALRTLTEPGEALRTTEGQPTFETLAGLVDELTTDGFPLSLTYVPDDDHLAFSLAVSDSATLGTPLAPGSLDVLDDIVLSGSANLAASYSVDLGAVLDLSPLPPEAPGAGPLSCVDGLDNDAADGIDAADPDCAALPTLDQRVLVDVGTATGTPEITSTMSVDADTTGTARIGMLGVELGPVSVEFGNGDGDPATNPAAVSLDIHETGVDANGLLTIEELFNAFSADPGNAAVTSAIDAAFSADLAASAQLGSESLGTATLGVTASVDGPFDDPGALLADGTFMVDGGLETSNLYDFSPCDDGATPIDDDGDGVANDGCPGSGAPPVADPESESTAALQSIIQMIQGLALQFGGDELDEEIPLLGMSFSDLVDVAGPLDTLAATLSNPAESAIPGACDPGNTTDDDFDGLVNDGCPTKPDAGSDGIDPSPEVGAACAEAPGLAADDDGDGVVNDGCLPRSPSFQTLADMLAGLVEREFQSAIDELALAATTPTASVSVTPTYDSATGDLQFVLTADLEMRTGSAFSFDIGEAVPQLAGYDVVALETSGEIAVDVNAGVVLGFGMEMDGFTPFLLGDTAVTIDARAAGEDLEISGGIGPVKIQLGNPDPVPEDATEGHCDPGDTTDDDGDGFVNDGCDPQPSPEPDADCADGADDDGDGVADDGCANAAAAVDDAETACGNGIDDDDDDVADDGCGTDTAEATDGGGGPQPEDVNASECDRANTDDEDDDGLVNDGCPARGNPGLAYVGASFGVEEAAADGTKVYLDDVDFSGSPGLSADPPAECDDLVGNADADACASLPIYLAVGSDLDYVTGFTIDWDDFGSTPNVTIDHQKLLDAIGDQAFDLLLLESGLGKWLERLEALLRDGLFGLELPLIGDGLADAADFIAGLQDLDSAVSTALGGTNPLEGAADAGGVQTAADAVASAIDAELPDAIQTGPVSALVECDDSGSPEECDGDESLGDVADVSFTVPLGQTADAPLAEQFDIGVDGLGLESDGTIDVEGTWALTVGLGVSRTDGFYIDTETENELSLSAALTLPDKLTGRLGFLQVDILPSGGPSTPCSSGSETIAGVETCDVDDDGVALAPSTFAPSFTVDLLGDGDDRLTFDELTNSPKFDELFEYSITADADVNLHIVTSVDASGSFPRLLADLHLGWGFALTNADDPGELRDPSAVEVELNNVALDAGSFMREFLGPIVRDAQKFTKPLDPVIDQLTAPIPVLSDFAGQPVTLIDLIEFFASSEVDLSLLNDLVTFIDFINSLDVPAEADGLFIVPIGDVFDLDSDRLLSGPVDQSQARSVYDSSQLTSLDAGGSLVGALDGATGDVSDSEVKGASGLSEIGLFFPFLDQPSQLMGLLFQQDVDLIIWQPGELTAEFSYSQKFGPIWSLPPVFLEVGGSAKVTGRFGIGYDTQGLREILFEGADAGALLHGMFLLDHRLKPDGTFAAGDPAEIELTGRLFANAQVSVLIFSAGAEGSVYLTVGLNVHDDNNDGKLKYQEAADILRATGNPICLFDFEGEFGVDIDVFAEVDLFFWSQKWVKNLANIILYEWEVNCADPKEPTLATGTTVDLDDTATYPRPDGSEGEFYGPGDENVLELNLGALRSQRGSNTVGIDEHNEEFVVTEERDGSVSVTALGLDQNFPAPAGGWDAVFVDGGSDDDSDATNLGFDIITLADNVQKGENTPVAGDEGDNASNRCGADTSDNDGDGFVNDGCPAEEAPESGPDCENATDDDGDGLVNDGCPSIETTIPFTLDAYIIGSDGADQITGGHGKHVIWSGGGGDRISTKEGQDKVAGEAGADQIGLGNDPNTEGQEDYASGGDQDDVIDGGPGRDILHGGPGDDVITGGLTIPFQPGDPNSLTGDIPEQPDGGDKIYGEGGSDDLEGGPADDLLVGGADPDRLNGGEGNDTLWGNGENSTGGAACTVMPTDASYDDVIVGGPGSDTAHGGGGDDIVVGGNVLPGGDDVGDALLDGDAGCDLVLGDNAEFADAADPRAFAFVDPDIGGADTIEGGGGADELHGMKGGDTILGQGGDDRIFGEAGGDSIDAGSGDDDVWGDGGPGTPFPYPNAGDDDIVGGDGADDLFGEEGADDMLGDDGTVDGDEIALTGGIGVDHMFGGHGPDRMYGQASNDVMRGDSGKDHMLGNDGADDMRGGIGDDEMFGNDGDTSVSPAVGDTMRGDAGIDHMVGGSDVEDPLSGGSADDGGDIMFGGSGPDVMVGDNGVISEDGVETLQSDGTPAEIGGLGGAGDRMYGEAANDDMFGELGNDYMVGGTGDDYLEGNANGAGPSVGVDVCDDAFTDPHADHLIGGPDSDDLIGGGDDPGFADGADCMYGGGNADVMAGDNADISRPGGDDTFDAYDGAVTRHVVLLDLFADQAGIAGADVMFGGDAADRMFGGGVGEQVMHGDDGDDYMEGNGGGDVIYGDAGQDDIIGGTSQNDDPDSVFTGRDVAPGGNPPTGPIGGGVPDGADVIHGDGDGDDLTDGTADDHDLIAGDNASLIRPVDNADQWFLDDIDSPRGVDQVARRVLQLFDVATDADPNADVGVSGGDMLYGQNGFDIVYGQGMGDTIRGGLVDDYLEGGNGSDDIHGNDGQDDIVGGTGRTRTDDPSTADDGRLDAADTLFGGNGDPSAENDGSDVDDFDVVMGDNATVLRGATGAPGETWTHHDFGGVGVSIVDRTVTLHDVANVEYSPAAGTSGGDTLYGEDDDDLLHGQGGADTAFGGGGDDVIEGNEGDDTLHGEGDQDDMLGGTGLIRWWNDLAGAVQIDSYVFDELVGGTAGRLDGVDTMFGGPDHDVMLGDNGIIDRLPEDATDWSSQTYGHFIDQHDAGAETPPSVEGSFTRWERTVRMTDAHEDDGGSAATAGSDLMSGGDGDDEMYGQFDDTADDENGSFSMTTTEIAALCPTSDVGVPTDGLVELWGDLMCGGNGEDAILGDQGVVTPEVATGPAEFIEPNSPFVTEWIDIPDSLVRWTELTTFEFGGDDAILGGAQSDSVHAGAGGDVVNAEEGDDRVFGGDSPELVVGKGKDAPPPPLDRVDALWGGPDNDHIYGGHGDDFVDVQPRSGIANFPDDPERWFVFAPLVDSDPNDPGPNGDGFDRFPGFEDFDQIYGGWDQDAMQADKGDNGPIRGDRLLDWSGAHNVSYLCPSTYGAWVTIRAEEPGLIAYLEDMGEADGLVDVRTDGSSGYNELAMVYKPDVKFNNTPPHPDTPGHFSCDFVP